MFYKWISSTKYKGVRYHQHITRKHGIQFDRLFGLRYQVGGKRYENILGWSSEGWTEAKSGIELAKLKEAYKLGEDVVSLSEKRKIANEKRQKREKIQKEEEKQFISFSNFWEQSYWKSQQHKAKGSLVAEKALYEKWIAPVIGNKALIKVAPADLEQIKQNMLLSEKSPSSIKYAFAVISQVWTLAKRDDLVYVDSPTKKVVLPKKDNRRERFLNENEACILLNQLKQHSVQAHDMAVLALYCGLRFGEIASLEWQSVDLKNATLSIRDPKSRMNRTAFLTSIPLAMLEDRKYLLLEMGKPALGLIFPSRKNDVMKSISETYTRVANKLFNQQINDSRQKVCFHTLRHTFASWLVQRGVDLYSVKELLGHADFKMTQRYSHLSPEGLRKAVSVIE